MATDSSLCLILLLAVFGVHAESVLELPTGSRTINTMLGCTETLICEGIVNEIGWRNRTDVLTDNTMVVAMEDGLLRSYLTLSNITLTNGGKYNCDLKGEKQFSIPTMIEVDDTYVRIDHVDDIDISSTPAGSSLSLTCRVTTCQKEMTVSIIKGTQLVHQQKFKNENHVTVSADLTVSADTADACACHVLLPVGQVYMQRFSITGVPLGIPDPQSSVGNDPVPGDKSTRPTSEGKGSSCVNVPQLPTISGLLLILAAVFN